MLRVTQAGAISPLVQFGNVAPTGLELSGNIAYVGLAGPIPHQAEDAQVVAVRLGSGAAIEVASGEVGGEIGLTVDVESGRGEKLLALLQGDWDLPIAPENEGAPASPKTGELVEVEKDGTYTTVVSGLDRPTSLEVIGNTAFVVSLTGTIIRIDDVSSSPFG